MEKWSVCVCTVNSCDDDNGDAADLTCCSVLSLFSLLQSPTFVEDMVLSSNPIKPMAHATH
eukprot:11108583-Ditylum_brightwellii.AAC.1